MPMVLEKVVPEATANKWCLMLYQIKNQKKNIPLA
jgi:hypothetical protein